MDKLRRVLDVNVTGMATTLAAFAPAMRKAGRGTLAGIASVASFRGLAGNGAYCASKAAARSWLESLRLEPRVQKVIEVKVEPALGSRDRINIELAVLPAGATQVVRIGPFTLELAS